MLKRIIILMALSFSISYLSNVQYLPAQEEVSKIQRSEELLQKDRQLREMLQKEKKQPQIQQEIFIKRIKVIGVTLLSKEKISKIISSFENQRLSLNQIQELVQEVLDAYQERGYCFASSYQPLLRVKKDILMIKIKERYLIRLQ